MLKKITNLASRISAYHRTRGGLLIFGLVELMVAFVGFVGTYVILGSEWVAWLYFFGLLLAVILLGFMQNMVRLAIILVRRQPSTSALSRKHQLVLISLTVFAIVVPLLVGYFPNSQELPSFKPSERTTTPAQSIQEYLCAGANYDPANPRSCGPAAEAYSGFPFAAYDAYGGMWWDERAVYLDRAAAVVAAAGVAAGATFAGSVVAGRVRRSG